MPVAPAPDSLAQAGPAAAPELVIGHRYEGRTASGLGFVGKLKEVSATELVFETTSHEQLTIKRNSLAEFRNLEAVAPGQPAAHRYFDIGNGTRYFFGPSGRNLRAGEGVVQGIEFYVLGVNYGITNNVSLGAYVSVVPDLALKEQFVMLTPKVGFQTGEKWHLGAGALYIRVPEIDDSGNFGAGLLYGVATHGSADNNFSLGLGYGFANNDIGSTPTLYLAGQKRVSRRISLMTENYIVAAHNPTIFGLYGLKFNWPRVSLGMAGAYVGYIDNDTYLYGYSGGSYDDSFFGSTYILPVYFDLSFRFGKVVKANAQP